MAKGRAWVEARIDIAPAIATGLRLCERDA